MRRPDRDIFSSRLEQTTSTEGPVLEEFIPIKKRASSSLFCDEEDEDDEQHSHKQRELEKKRKEKTQLVYERKKQLNKLRVKAEKVVEDKLGSQLDILAPVKY
ncbi:60S ribosomal protein L13a [Glycine soja]